MIMSKERVEGAVQKAVGAAKQSIGKAVGNEKLQVEGAADKVVGSVKEAVGKAKDAIHKATR
ncbi:MAG: CsbD family protein [Caulobacteraceae bacterium]|nr:CsbD family protein [Caulobacteraceae bacterium]